MHIPIRVDYGVRALVDLARNTGDRPVRATEIAARAAIPEPYLAQVLNALSKKGLIRSQRGPQGGHMLAMRPADIRLSAVMACLGTTEGLVGCLDGSTSCIHTPGCAQREVWQAVEKAVFDILDSTTVADLVARTEALQDERIRQTRAVPVVVT